MISSIYFYKFFAYNHFVVCMNAQLLGEKGRDGAGRVRGKNSEEEGCIGDNQIQFILRSNYLQKSHSKL